MTVRAYCRVSTTEQREEGYGLDAQRTTIRDEAQRRGWTSIAWYEDGKSGKDMDRPDMTRLLDDVKPGDVVVVSKLDRLSRSLSDFAALVERAQHEGWTVQALDLGVDLSTPVGELVASIMAALAQWERKVIGARTKDALAEAKEKGKLPGRRCQLPDETRQRMTELRGSGLSLRRVADALNAEGLLTVSGCRWKASGVHAALRSIGLEAEAARVAI